MGEPEDSVLVSAVLPQTIERAQLEAALGISSAKSSAQATVRAETTAPPLYRRYTAQSGDTASSIAERFGISLQYLLWNNPELRDSDVLSVGDVLFIPAGDGILHYVAFGETLGGIASYYGIPPGSIIGWAGNNLDSPDQITNGQLIFVPNGIMPAPYVPEPAPILVAVPLPPPPPPPAAPVVSGPVSNSGYSWPYSCSISRGFSGGHAGIDIDGVCNPSSAIGSATNGTVIAAVTSSFNGYGRYVDVQRSDGVVTRYAHLSSINVSMGQQVSQGQSLGIIGCTGSCTGVHLHFEVWINGSPVNPLSYLP